MDEKLIAQNIKEEIFRGVCRVMSVSHISIN